MSMHLRLLGLSAFGLLSLAAPARSQDYVDAQAPLPGQVVYTRSPNVVTQTTVVRTPIGPTAYVQAPPVAVYRTQPVVTTTYVPTRYVRSRTTYLPAAPYVAPTTYVQTSAPALVDPALAPVGYEVVRTRRNRLIYPRRVVRYVY